MTVRPETGELEVRFKNRPLFVYASGSKQFKPYLRELYSLEGDNILQDAPPDHLHHHGLMYAVGVNGINFWEERVECGRERPVQWLAHSTGRTPDGLPEARFSQLIHWVAAKDNAAPDTAEIALLVERRTITVTVDEPRQEVALRWQADFEAGRGVREITLGGTAYNGLGLRLPKEFDHVARHQNSGNLAYSAEAKGDVTPARWSSVTGAVKDHELCVALFGRAGDPPQFFTMLNPFAYLAITQGLDKTPRKHSMGERFSVDYLLTVGPASQTPELLQKRYEQWQRAPGAGHP